ncbi:MAG TPA: sugar ABC transporter permease [Chthonomonadales bacterium]|nr:sugar ABC transporter permease [Chthonomonadales bacterium]
MALSDRRKEAIGGYLFLLPNLLGFAAFTAIPVVASLVFAFTRWDLFQSPRWVGTENFVSLLGFARSTEESISVLGLWRLPYAPNDPFFWQYLYNTVFLMLGIPAGLGGSLALAVALNRRMPGVVVFRTLYFLPSVTSGVAVLVLWKWLYNADIGLINLLLSGAGVANPPDWLGDSQWAKPALIIMGFVMGVGGSTMILYLAALQGVPRDLYEAAEIDGASAWQQFRTVTWPLISPTTFFLTIMAIIGGFQGGFMQAFIMTGGGPAGSTTTLEFYIYNKAFTVFNMGYASAIAWFLFVIILLLSLATWRFGGRAVQYH